MNISFDEGVAFSQWLENRGPSPLSYLKEMVFSNNFVVINTEMHRIFIEENAGKNFIPGVEIETRRVKNLKIVVDFKKHKKFRVLKHFSGVWYLLGLEKNSGYIKLTTLSKHQMMKLLGEYFEEEYYTKIFKK
jgi:hypothetical protein